MEETRLISRYAAVGLLLVGGLEWLLGRTVSRMAASPVLEGTPRDIIVTLGQLGLFLVSPAFLLALCLLAAGLWTQVQRPEALRQREQVALVIYLALIGALIVAYTLLPTSDWLTTSFNILMWAALLWVGLRHALDRAAPRLARMALLPAVLGYSGWYAYVLAQQALPSTTSGETLGLWAISLGELFAVLTPIAFFAAVVLPSGEWRHPRRWIFPVVLALLFSGGSISDAVANEGFTGVFTTWSLGINITWPWPLYALSLALYAYTVLTCFLTRNKSGLANRDIGAGLLLLLVAGYNLQTSYQHLFALIALLLLTGFLRPFAETERYHAPAYEVGTVPHQNFETKATK